MPLHTGKKFTVTLGLIQHTVQIKKKEMTLIYEIDGKSSGMGMIGICDFGGRASQRQAAGVDGAGFAAGFFSWVEAKDRLRIEVSCKKKFNKGS